MAESQADPSIPRNAGGSRPDPILITAEPVVASTQEDRIANEINRRIFETSLDLIFVVDRRGTFIRVSPSALTILGYRPDEMVGRSATEFLYHEDLENTRDEMRQARRGRLM